MQFLIVEFTNDGIFDVIYSACRCGVGKCKFPTANAEKLLLSHTTPNSVERRRYVREITNFRLISEKSLTSLFFDFNNLPKVHVLNMICLTITFIRNHNRGEKKT